MEVISCSCGSTEFRFVLASDVDHLRNSIVCSGCIKPMTDEGSLNKILELATK